METLIEIFWHDLSEEKQQELLEAGFVDENVINETFPLTEICIYSKEEEE